MNKFNETLNRINLYLNPEKCKVLFFNKNRNNNLSIKLNNDKIEEVTNARILGLQIDNRLTMNSHIKIVKEKINPYINLLKIFSNMNWGAHPNKAMSIYKALIESRTLYGLIEVENVKFFNKIQIFA